MAKVNNTRNKCGKDVEKGEPSYTLVRMQTGIATLENSIGVPQKVKNGIRGTWVAQSVEHPTFFFFC